MKVHLVLFMRDTRSPVALSTANAAIAKGGIVYLDTPSWATDRSLLLTVSLLYP